MTSFSFGGGPALTAVVSRWLNTQSSQALRAVKLGLAATLRAEGLHAVADDIVCSSPKLLDSGVVVDCRRRNIIISSRTGIVIVGPVLH